MAIIIGTDENGYLQYINEPEIDQTLSKNGAEFTNDERKTLSDVSDEVSALTDEVSALTEKTTMISDTFEFFGNDTNIYKYGSMVQVQYFGASKIELTGSTDVVVGTLPEGFRPVERVAWQLFTSSSSKIQIVFNTDGTVKVYNFNTTLAANSGWIRCAFVFMAAEPEEDEPEDDGAGD